MPAPQAAKLWEQANAANNSDKPFRRCHPRSSGTCSSRWRTGTGVAIIAVDPAYTSQWGREHWHKELNYSRRTPCSSHHAAAVVIGRRALTLTAKRKTNTRDDHTGIRQRTKQQCKQRVVARRSRVSQRSQPAQGTTRRKRGNTSSAPPRTVRGAQTNWAQPPSFNNEVVETPTRKPITLQRQDTATVQGARPGSRRKANRYQQTERFNSNRDHRNGTRFDNEECTYRGFDRAGEHRNGTRLDDDGYDAAGFDRAGFSIDGFDRDGNHRDS